MCQAKSEGGRRCNPRLVAGLAHTATTHASAVSRLPLRETAAAFDDLTAEGARNPAPTRGETDALLRDLTAQVRREPALAEPVRRSLLDHLRAALGRVRLSGGQFHAIRHIASEAWHRVGKRVAAVAIAAPMVLGLAACGTSGHQDTHSAQQGTVATAPASPSVAQPSSKPTVSPATYDQDAVTTFGQHQAEQGYEQVITSLRDYFLQPRLLATTTPTAADFDGLADQMTPACAQDYRTKVASMLGGDLDAYNAVGVVSLYGTQGEGFTVAESGRVLSDWKISDTQVSVDRSTGAPRLRVSEQQQATIRGSLNGGPGTVQVTQTATYLLAPSTSTATGWAIDGWEGTFSTSNPTAAH